MSKFQLPGSVIFDSHIKIHTGTENKYASLANELKDNMQEEHRQNGAKKQYAKEASTAPALDKKGKK